MKRYWTIGLILILCNGCGNRQALPPAQPAGIVNPTQNNASAQSESENKREVPMEIIQNIPSRLKLLKSGMAKDDVFKILGLTGYSPIAYLSGPMTRYGHSYRLRTNYVLTVTFDETKNAFRSARLDGDGWEKESK